jgi:hypothetical protein
MGVGLLGGVGDREGPAESRAGGSAISELTVVVTFGGFSGFGVAIEKVIAKSIPTKPS